MPSNGADLLTQCVLSFSNDSSGTSFYLNTQPDRMINDHGSVLIGCQPSRDGLL